MKRLLVYPFLFVFLVILTPLATTSISWIRFKSSGR
jgi:hypothetical protein